MSTNETDIDGRTTGAASLQVLSEDRIVFSSTGKWLHPLFELEEFLTETGLGAAALTVEDKIVGKAAAMLMVRLGFRRVHGSTMSRLAERVFEAHRVQYSYDRMVERIDCRTESLLADEEDVERAYTLVRERAGR